ncbi:MAG TPA: 3-deoxy-D-manno-octulosonate 8-phosphate phosphatase [Bacteroidota bacterium]|nr:3-deoxy-D-manno-octulosonate 8-phosphate phosphatase [Bacteroidota bacterium]
MVTAHVFGQALTAAELQRRAKNVVLVLTDNDGVLTDNGVYYSAEGEAMKRYSIRDGMGVSRLRQEGIETGIISGEGSMSLLRRSEKLLLSVCYFGVADKESELSKILMDTHLSTGQIAYIGDDVNDIGIIRAIGTHGLTGAPADAMPAVKEIVHFVGQVPGGHGAFREFAEWLIALRNPQQDETTSIPSTLIHDEVTS